MNRPQRQRDKIRRIYSSKDIERKQRRLSIAMCHTLQMTLAAVSIAAYGTPINPKLFQDLWMIARQRFELGPTRPEHANDPIDRIQIAVWELKCMCDERGIPTPDVRYLDARWEETRPKNEGEVARLYSKITKMNIGEPPRDWQG